MELNGFFNGYSSNTLGGSGNQCFFLSDRGVKTGRIYYKVQCGGEYEYSLLFTNVIDSTYSDGSVSVKNLACGQYEIFSVKAAACESDWFSGLDIADAEAVNGRKPEFTRVLFDGCESKTVASGEAFKSDGFTLDVAQDGYICVEIDFAGEMMPYHEESLLPIYVQDEGRWVYSKRTVLPCCVACRREVKKRVAFWGDSITQGIGCRANGYRHWNALLAKRLGDAYSYWNIGLGYGRAQDAASDGIWMKKALCCDIVFVCFGVNDILQSIPPETVKDYLLHTVRTLKEQKKTVILQTLPPFDYSGRLIEDWHGINRYIKEVLCGYADLVFDNTLILGLPEERHKAAFSGHPNEEGCALWADALYVALKENGIF